MGLEILWNVRGKWQGGELNGHSINAAWDFNKIGQLTKDIITIVFIETAETETTLKCAELKINQ